MKKIIMVLVIFISSIIFYDSYVNLSQKQYNDVINLSYKFAQENDMEVIPIDLKLSEDKQDDSGNLKITNLDRLIFTKNGEFTI